MNKFKIFALLGLATISIGCASILEPFKLILGTSTKALEDARFDAISKEYKCTFDECYDAILSLDRKKKETLEDKYSTTEQKEEEPVGLLGQPKEEDDGRFDVFMKNPIKGYVVVMGVIGNEETTEVGIFLSYYSSSAIKVEISSLSRSAKERVANSVFKKLDELFPEVK